MLQHASIMVTSGRFKDHGSILFLRKCLLILLHVTSLASLGSLFAFSWKCLADPVKTRRGKWFSCNRNHQNDTTCPPECQKLLAAVCHHAARSCCAGLSMSNIYNNYSFRSHLKKCFKTVCLSQLQGLQPMTGTTRLCSFV